MEHKFSNVKLGPKCQWQQAGEWQVLSTASDCANKFDSFGSGARTCLSQVTPSPLNGTVSEALADFDSYAL